MPGFTAPDTPDDMIRVEGPPINANIGTKLERLHKPLRTVVTSLAERLERAEPEFINNGRGIPHFLDS
jgi:hypothetical protein